MKIGDQNLPLLRFGNGFGHPHARPRRPSRRAAAAANAPAPSNTNVAPADPLAADAAPAATNYVAGPAMPAAGLANMVTAAAATPGPADVTSAAATPTMAAAMAPTVPPTAAASPALPLAHAARAQAIMAAPREAPSRRLVSWIHSSSSIFPHEYTARGCDDLGHSASVQFLGSSVFCVRLTYARGG
ncbi:unnamed protein product [Penicillium glandicola]